MSLIYFDGMDQYAAVLDPSSGTPVTFGLGASPNILATVPTDPSPITMTTQSMMFTRHTADPDRVYAQMGRAFYSAQRAFVSYTDQTAAPAYAHIGTADRFIQFDAGKPASDTTSITFGYKIKLASNLANNWHVLGIFSTDTSWGTDSQAAIDRKFGICLHPQTGTVRLMTMRSLFGYIVADTVFPVGTFKEDSTNTGLLGVSNFVFGTITSSPIAVPPAQDLPANTVEVSVYADGRVSVWINNLFVGALTFNNPARCAGCRYIRLGMGPQYASYPGGAIAVYLTNAFSDFYLLNGLGTRNNSRLGKVKVVTRVPKTDVSVQFVRPDTANSNAEVAGQLPTKLTPALTGTKTGDTDIYGSDAFKFTNEAIIATAVTTGGYKTDPTGNDIAPVLKIGSQKYVGNTNVVPIGSSSMKLEQTIYELNPATGLPFTKTDLDASQFGVTVVEPNS